jgi:two-component system OmpR family response regulator/two-component system copper resistance phosphate regulon response regulator CusR
VDNRVAGLNKGADYYLVKPFAMTELLACIDVICRRATMKPSAVVQVKDVTLDLSTRRVTCAGLDVELTPTEFSILEMLMRHAGQVVTRKMLCESLWESDWEGTTNVIEVHINRLRAKLQRGVKESLIHTVRGRGYALRTAN